MSDHWTSALAVSLAAALMVALALAPIAGADDIDTDGDGLTTQAERYHRTNPSDFDTDDDGISDGAEVVQYQTNPAIPDTDGDGRNDGRELGAGTNPLVSDPPKQIGQKKPPKQIGRPDGDGDGLFDSDETNVYGTDPGRPDTDGDGVPDGEEVFKKTDPRNPSSK